MTNGIRYMMLLCMLCFTTPVSAQGYTVSPTVPDFTDLRASCVVATWGSVANPFQHPGLADDHHAVITTPGTDPNTGGRLQLLPEGAPEVVRLGNARGGAEAEAITYHFIVDSARSVLRLRFAFVNQHLHAQGANFIVRIMDARGNRISSCLEYDLTGQAREEEFQVCKQLGTPIYWKDWANISLNMSSCAGQEVQVQIITQDCKPSEHFGYAYFTASCVSDKLRLEECNGKDFTLAAPAGFSSYLWSDGATTPAISRTLTGSAVSLSCRMTSAHGCQYIRNAYVSSGNDLPTRNHLHIDRVCENGGYSRFGYNIPARYRLGQVAAFYSNQVIVCGSYFDLSTCTTGTATGTLVLDVDRNLYHTSAGLCRGEDYVKDGFAVRNALPGTYSDTLRYARPGRCDSIVTLHLTVADSFSMGTHLEGNTSPCTGTYETYTIPDAPSGSYRWDLPEEAWVVRGQLTRQITLMFAEGARRGTIRAHGTNGCGERSVTLEVAPNPAYWQEIADTVCSGQEFHGHGFHLVPQTIPGRSASHRYLKTRQGCDSIITLHLLTSPTPQVSISTADTIVCTGQEVRLNAAFPEDSLASLVSVGDILCTDGTTVTPAQYAAGGKTALGVVFWVDNSGRHGWAVHPQVQCEACEWARGASTPIPIPAKSTEFEALCDTSGYENTRAAWNYGNRGDYPVLEVVDFDNGWYVPAIGQLNLLRSATLWVNRSLALIGGSPLTKTESQDLYSSTPEAGKTPVENMYIMFYNDIELGDFSLSKTLSSIVRTIRNF